MVLKTSCQPKPRRYLAISVLSCFAFLCLLALWDSRSIKGETNVVKQLPVVVVTRHNNHQVDGKKMYPTTPALDTVQTHVQVVARGTNIQVGTKEIHLTTAVYYDDYPERNSFNILLNGWARHNINMDFKCCLISSLTSSKTSLKEVPAKVYHVYTQWKVDMQNAEFSCSVPRNKITVEPQKPFQYVTFGEQNCSMVSRSVLKIEYPQRIKDSVGICLKISYGEMDIEKMLEWIEYVKLLGVTRVFTFISSDLDPEARNVFQHYTKNGFLETNPIDPAVSKNGIKRGFKRPRYEQQAWVDEVMAINDCKHRMSGFDYVMIQDMDEYVVPSLSTGSYLSILKTTSERHPKAGSFMFNSYVTALDWKESRSSPTHLMSRVHRTSFANYDNPGTDTRWAFMPHRTFYSRNNQVYNRKPYTKVEVPASLCILQHRRLCKENWKDCTQLLSQFKVEDTRILRYEDKLISALRSLPLEKLLPDSNHTKYINGLLAWKPKKS